MVSNTQLEPTLEDLAIEAATFLETLPTYVSDNTLCRAGQMAFALRTCVQGRTSAATTSPETPVGNRRCTKCGHFETVDLHDEGECQVVGQSGFICGCKCEFAAPIAATTDNEGGIPRDEQ